VTGLSPWRSAIAAICALNCEIGRPAAFEPFIEISYGKNGPSLDFHALELT